MSRNGKYVNLEFYYIKNPLLVIIPFLYPRKHLKNFSFLKFLASIENEYWPGKDLVSRHECCAEGNKTVLISLPKTFSSYQWSTWTKLKKKLPLHHDFIVWLSVYSGLRFVKTIERVGSRFSCEWGVNLYRRLPIEGKGW